MIQAVLEGKADQLVLVNCCDSMRRVYDIVKNTGKCTSYICWIFLMKNNECEKVKFAGSIQRLKEAYEKYSGKKFDRTLFLKAFAKTSASRTSYIGVLGVRVSGILEKMIRDNLHMDVRNLTVPVGETWQFFLKKCQEMEEDRLLLAYADALLGQMPCFRMNNNTKI